MNSKRNQILLGVIIFAIGLLTFLFPGGSFLYNFRSVIFIAAGLAFLLLYKTKKHGWSLIFGSYLTFTGVAWLLSPIIGTKAVLSFIGSMFFIVPAIVFLVLYFDKNKRELLVPASLMLWFGIFLCAKDFPGLRDLNSIGLFLICFGASFLTMFVLGKSRIGRWALITGAVLALIGLISVIAGLGPFGIAGMIFSNLGRILAVLLIAASIFIIIKAAKK